MKLIGTQSNRDAMGAKVALTVGDETQFRYVSPTRSYLSQVELPVTFGLGSAEQIDALRITWPSGQEQVLTDVSADQELVITENPS